MEARLQLKQTQKLIMTQMLQQAIKLLPLSRLELVQTIRQELMENPLLEEILLEEEDEEVASTDKEEPASEADDQDQSEPDGEIDWDLYMQDMTEMGLTSSYDRQEMPSYEATLSRQMSLADYLLWQLALAAPDDATKEIGTYLIGNIDEEGYLTIPLEEVSSSFNLSEEQVEGVLRLIQTLDPTGVGSRNLKECLLLQIHQGELNGTLVERVVEKHLENIDERYFPRIARDLGVTVEEIVQTVQLIRELDPKPGLKHSLESPGYIIPDVIVLKVGDDYQVFLNEEGVPRLRVNAYYYNMLRRRDSLQVEAKKFVEDKMRSAVWLMKSIEQRRQTLYKVANSIVRFQSEFLDKGTRLLKPLILKDVAEDIGMHESTVSRVTTNKYMHTPQGIFELKYFFHSGLDSLEGETMSSVMVKDMIKKLVEKEDPREPLTDQQIVDELHRKNIQIARRTVTKYRKEMKIAQSSRRRRIYTI
jgi:RNA polymerase sigma-54 factor